MGTPVPPCPKPHGLLEGKTVLLTAAAGTGIGFATALRCAEEGATVMISDIHERRVAEAAAKITEATGKPVLHRLCNVVNEEEVQGLIDAAVAAMGRIDVLINNAGLGGFSPVVDMTDDQWLKVIDVTLTGTFRMTRAALRQMKKQESGVIVNNASVLAWRAQAGQSHYAAAKAGVMALTRCAAIEAAEFNVRINAVSPSIAMHEFLSKVTPPGLLDELEKKEAFGRAAETWEVATVMVFLASDYSTYMTGEIVAVSSQHP